MNTQQIIKFKIIILIAVFLVPISSVFAAEVFFEVESPQIKMGDEFEVNLFINTEEEDINAIEGNIIFPEKLLKLKEIRDGNSIINFWNERPKIGSNNILFSGIIPGGYFDKRGLIFSVIFESIQEGAGSIKITNTKALLNDGKGTETKTTISDFQFVVSQYAPASQLKTIEKKDIDVPEEFNVTITKDPTIFNGKYFLVFATQDKGSGINYYEVCEERRTCVRAESPYLLQNQNPNEEILVKAVDNNGNERVVRLNTLYKNYLFYVIITIGIILIFLTYKFLWKKYKK